MLFLYCEKIPVETFGKTKWKEIKMEAWIMIIAIGLGVGTLALVYLFLGKRNTRQDTQGMLNIIYDENSRNPQLVLALYDEVEIVAGQKQVLFDVNIIEQNSRK
jgi:hypothetical protein